MESGRQGDDCHPVVFRTTGPQALPNGVLQSPLSVYSILSFLKIIQQLLTPSSSPSLPLYPSITCFRRLFLREMQMQLAFIGVIVDSNLHRAMVERLVSSSNPRS